MPLSLHGDAGTFTKTGESVVVISWSSLLLKGPTWQTTFLAVAIPKSALNFTEEANTLELIFAHFVADLMGLFYMRHPEVDGLGQPWREG